MDGEALDCRACGRMFMPAPGREENYCPPHRNGGGSHPQQQGGPMPGFTSSDLNRAMDQMIAAGEMHEADGKVMTQAAYEQAVKLDPAVADRAQARRTEIIERLREQA